MRLKSDFELVDIAGEKLAVPVGATASTFDGVVALSEAAFYLLGALKEPKTEEDLISLLTQSYEVDDATARADVDSFVGSLLSVGLIEL